MIKTLAWVGIVLFVLNIWCYFIDKHWYNLFAGIFVLFSSIFLLLTTRTNRTNRNVGF
jgi:hypothetical protein